MKSKLATLLNNRRRLEVHDIYNENGLKEAIKSSNQQIVDYVYQLAYEGRLFFADNKGRVRQVHIKRDGEL